MKKMNRSGIADRLVKSRKAANLSQTELGNAVNLNQRTISSYENGSQLPSLENLYAISNVLRTDPLFILTGTHEENYTLAKDIGISNESINILQYWNKIAKNGDNDNHVAEAIDLLLQNIPLLFQIRNYLTEASQMDISYSEVIANIQPFGEALSFHEDEVRTIKLQDYEALHRLKLLDSLSDYRKKLYEEMKKNHPKEQK